ncbi:MAG: threonine aldolase [Saprospiraceae bacterium]|nr:MAG: threonine aldolase [Saprospiraceae bacterium]
MSENWFKISNEDEVESPSILLFPDRIKENIRRMIALAGNVQRLRPHVKTHKLPQVIQMQVDAGISRFKCATLSEASMVAENGGKDIIIAYPLYGPAIGRLFQLKKHYPKVKFSTVVDNITQCQLIEQQAESNGMPMDVFIDLDVGMERTGIKPGKEAFELYVYLGASPWLQPRGLHIYDGHLHIPDATHREAIADAYFIEVYRLIDELKNAGMEPEELACGGTPSFPIHAKHPDRILCPGTLLLWDWRYFSQFSDLNFQHAAVLFCRVISKPGSNKLCLDLGHKAVGSEMSPPRVHLLGIPDYNMEVHSEEHMVISFEGADRFSVGDCIYGIPIHICPTMALHDWARVVTDHQAKEKWQIKARTREVIFV